MEKRSIWVTVIFLLFSTFSLSGISLEEFKDQVYLQEKTDDQLYESYLKLQAELKTDAEKIELEYYMARAFQAFDSVEVCTAHNQAMKKGRFLSLFDFYNRRGEAVLHYEKGLALIEPLEKQEGGLPVSYFCLKTDMISQLCLLKSLGYILANGLSIGKNANKVLAVDPNNVRAQLLIASAKVYPPKIYGGDPNQGIFLLEEALKVPSLTKEECFNIYSGLGYCYARLAEKEPALQWLDKALAIYPTNIFALSVKKMVEEGTF